MTVKTISLATFKYELTITEGNNDNQRLFNIMFNIYYPTDQHALVKNPNR